MRSHSSHRLPRTLCAGCLVQLAVVAPAFAQPRDTATPSDKPSQAPAVADGQSATTPSPTTRPSSSSPPPSPSSAPASQPALGASSQPAASTAPFPAETKSKGWLASPSVREVLSRFAPSIAFYYATSLVDHTSSEYHHSLGFMAALDYAATPSIILSTNIALYRVFDEDEERFVASNWLFGVTKTFDLPYAGTLYPSFFFNLPTNPDDWEYLDYRATVGVDIELRKYTLYAFRKHHAFGASVGFGTLRNIYQYTANKAGFDISFWQISAYLSANYKFRDFLMLLFKFGNNWRWGPEGKRLNDQYRMSLSAHYKPIQQLWLALSWYNADRTFLYDQTWNANLYSPQSTSLILSITYLPRISKTHELSR